MLSKRAGKGKQEEERRIMQNHTANCPSGNRYGVQTDNTYYVLLAYRGVVFDEKLKEDTKFLVDFYFEQDCACVVMWYKNENVAEYLGDLEYYFEKAFKYYVFFNPKLLRKAVRGPITLHYPVKAPEMCFYKTINASRETHDYHVYGDKLRTIESEPDVNFLMGQYFGFVESNAGVELIYAMAEDLGYD